MTDHYKATGCDWSVSPRVSQSWHQCRIMLSL